MLAQSTQLGLRFQPYGLPKSENEDGPNNANSVKKTKDGEASHPPPSQVKNEGDPELSEANATVLQFQGSRGVAGLTAQ